VELGVCGYPHYPAYFIFDPTGMVLGMSLIHTFPRIVHLGSYLRQSDAEHPPNVVFLMIVEEDSGSPPRYRANKPEIFIKARYELPPGTVLYANNAAFFAFIEWTPEAKQNLTDPGWSSPFPASEPGVYILEARSVSSGSLPVPMLLLPEAPGVSMDTPVPGTGVGDAALSAYGAPESSAAGKVISLVDSPERVLDSRSQFLIDDSSSTASAVVVRPSALAAAQAFLTPRDERSKTEEAAILAAREGRTPARSSRDDGYMAIPKPGGTHRDWPAIIAYLVTELEVSRRAVTAQDLRQLKKWAHNPGAVLRRAAQAGSSASAVGAGPPPQGSASQIDCSGRQEEGANRSGGYRSQRGSGYQRSCAGA
jgi:hypothetical protein